MDLLRDRRFAALNIEHPIEVPEDKEQSARNELENRLVSAFIAFIAAAYGDMAPLRWS